VKSVVQLEEEFLCLTGGSDSKLKLWDLRNRKCIKDYGGYDADLAMMDLEIFHEDSIWTIETESV